MAATTIHVPDVHRILHYLPEDKVQELRFVSKDFNEASVSRIGGLLLLLHPTILDTLSNVKCGWLSCCKINSKPHFIIDVVGNYGHALRFISKENQTDALCLSAVKQNGLSLRHVKNQTEDICIAAVRQNSKSYMYVKNKTYNIQLRGY